MAHVTGCLLTETKEGNGNYECKNEKCGFKSSDLEEFENHMESHKREEYIASQAIESTQGLIRSDLLLEVVN